MLHPYITLSDNTEICYSQIIQKDNKQIIEVHFERPTENGFDSARCSLPDYEWLYKDGYSNSDIELFEEFLKNNAHLIYRFSKNGGMTCA